MSYHKDQDTSDAVVALLDRLCTWERNTGRGSTLILVPHEDDEPIVFALDGKPVGLHFNDELSIALKRALDGRTTV